MEQKNVDPVKRALIALSLFLITAFVFGLTGMYSRAASAPQAAQNSRLAPFHWKEGNLNVRVFTDPSTQCQYLVFQTNNYGALGVTLRRGIDRDGCTS